LRVDSHKKTPIRSGAPVNFEHIRDARRSGQSSRIPYPRKVHIA